MLYPIDEKRISNAELEKAVGEDGMERYIAHLGEGAITEIEFAAYADDPAFGNIIVWNKPEGGKQEGSMWRACSFGTFQRILTGDGSPASAAKRLVTSKSDPDEKVEKDAE